MENREIKFICHAVKWFDKVNGNTYHSVRIADIKSDKVLKSRPVCYGYGDCYRQTAIQLMAKNKWIDEKYLKTTHLFERENNYPIYWDVKDGLKRDMKSNVQ